MVRSGILSLALVLLIGTLVACDAGAGVEYVNETSTPISFYLRENNDDFALRLLPHSQEKAATIKAVWSDVVVVRDDTGRLLFRQDITWQELEAQNFRVVITEDMIIR